MFYLDEPQIIFLNSFKNKEEDDIIFHLTSPFMTTEAQSGATSETYFWLGIHHSKKWKFVDGTEAIIRNTHKPQSDGPVGAFVLGKRQESVNPIT